MPRARPSILRTVGTWIWICAAATGCAPSEAGLSVELVSIPPERVSVEVSYPRVRVPVGIALTLELRPQSRRQREFAPDAPLHVASDQPSIVQALSTADPRRVLIVGSQPGNATVQIWMQDDAIGELYVEVTGARPSSTRTDSASDASPSGAGGRGAAAPTRTAASRTGRPMRRDARPASP